MPAELWPGVLLETVYHLQPVTHRQAHLHEMWLLLQRPPHEKERMSPETRHGAAGHVSHPLLCNLRPAASAFWARDLPDETGCLPSLSGTSIFCEELSP